MSVPDSVLHDVQPVNELMRAFYEVISFDEGGQPDWPRMAELFSPHARITRLTPEGTDYMDLAGFRNMAEELMEVGAFTSFYERELARRADRFGTVMHIASAYETKIAPDAGDYIERGINSLQLIWERDRWRILSLCWDVEAPFELDGMRPLSHGGMQDGQS
jgi:hypothetical protein